MSIVYHSEKGSFCPDCQKPLVECVCKATKTVAVQRQTKGRKGKGVVVISNIPGTPEEMQRLAKSLKTQLGCGGSVKNGTIEIQGDKLDDVVAIITKNGYKAKKSGG